MRENTELRSIIYLYVRQLWFAGYNDQNIPWLPSSKLRIEVLDDIAEDIDSHFRQTIVSHFVDNFSKYISVRLKEQAQVALDWPSDDKFRRYVLRRWQKEALDPTDHQVEKNLKDKGDVINNSVQNWIKSTWTHIRRTGKKATMVLVDQQLERKATVPRGWTTEKGFSEYLTAQIWEIPLEVDARHSSMINVEKCKEASAALRKATRKVQTDVDAFIKQEKNKWQRFVGRPIGARASQVDINSNQAPVDLFDCFGMKRVNQPTTGSRRQRDANSDEASNQGQDGNDSQDEAGSTEHAYILTSVLARILEDYP
ncbi:hypothetical protein INT45_002746 [Circinella minor]|uniref:Uncharacterized protein n=1 Tax=Circinella minor TaxID=1195481 RepID=A0A8H7VMB1_9FUNG|nr:hypothetical protein INT45_002746 [Circinella minor]